jgi:hypothetical protein
MTPDQAGTLKGDERRRARLAASLRENLKRRKAQSRSRAAQDAPEPEPAPAGAPREGEDEQ